MQESLDASLGTLQWVVNGYMLTLASLILLGGSAGDRFGRRRTFIAGLVGFTAASLACALAPSAIWLIAARMAQGVAAALLTPASPRHHRCSVQRQCAGSRDRHLGGRRRAHDGARTAARRLARRYRRLAVDLFINLPLGTAALALALKLPGDSGTGNAPPLDRRGSALATLSLGALCYGLITLGEGKHSAPQLRSSRPCRWLSCSFGRKQSAGADDAAGAVPQSRV